MSLLPSVRKPAARNITPGRVGFCAPAHAANGYRRTAIGYERAPGSEPARGRGLPMSDEAARRGAISAEQVDRSA